MYDEVHRAVRNIEINKNWLYHWLLNKNMLFSVYKNGILSKENLRKKKICFLGENQYNFGCNGENYISVCKKLEQNSVSYNSYIKNSNAFIIREDIPKINSKIICKEKQRSQILKNILGPKIVKQEVSIVNNPDEYLIKDKIDFSDIVGLKLPNFYTEYDVFNLVEFLIQIDCNLPIIDIERQVEIDQCKIKQLMRNK